MARWTSSRLPGRACRRAKTKISMATRGPSPLLSVVVVDRVLGAGQLAESSLAARSRHDQDFLGVRVFARLDVDHVGQRQIAHGYLAGVDDLVRHLRAAGRTRDHVMLSNRV